MKPCQDVSVMSQCISCSGGKAYEAARIMGTTAIHEGVEQLLFYAGVRGIQSCIGDVREIVTEDEGGRTWKWWIVIHSEGNA